ncbi:hypothetical protein LIX60_25385 [Streptomyces sp. S07_1.15]|uniref:hypothetical protein n=1 Tax=Streptomyces sp. S07_1.15 TaxID=2873925 RepID=UPI001D142F63|nr:hypothetical protein [Streptomyces sp. S07_1.15]MCC3654737.1 hypothetical protein [Streptomyces sp. S07_1.15]
MARTRRRPVRCPARTAEPVPGQLGLFGSPDPWQPTGCRCWPVDNRGCGHCRTCSACQDCGRCAGPGCACGCDDD